MAVQSGSDNVKKWLHINQKPTDYWLHRIYNTVSDKYGDDETFKIQKIGIDIITRMNMLPYISKRINIGCTKLYAALEQHEQDAVFTSNSKHDGYAIDVCPNITYELLIDLNSFLMEFKATNALIKKLLIQIYNLCGNNINKDDTKSIISTILKDSNLDELWYYRLDSHRNWFTHQTTPYIAIDVTSSNPELIIMKKNLQNFNTNNRNFWFRISELKSIEIGFQKAKDALSNHLISFIKNT